MNQETLQISERAERRKSLQAVRKQERPNPMRSELVDNYFTNIMRSSGGPASEVFKEIYKNVMDNRIFNNLKEQLNSMIEDEKSLISIEEFRKMFFTYFKGEYKAGLLYEKVLPFITVWEINGDVLEDLAGC